MAKHERFVKAALALFLVTLGGCATFIAPQNTSTTHIDLDHGYRGLQHIGEVGDVAVYLSFSGGGTRAAALSYGVLQELRDTEIGVAGQQRRLLDEVDQISSVSGGSFTAAYYGLYGDKIFESYEKDFLRQSVQGALIRKMISPTQWYRSLFTGFDRTEMAVEYYDETVFKGKTFKDMRPRPFVSINATDVSMGNRFAFTQEFFDLLCSDLDDFKVARAVTASSAVPVLFPSIVLKNRSDKCDVSHSPAYAILTQEKARGLREQKVADDLKTYLDSEKRPYIHLVDGGISDNLGIRAIVERVQLAGFGELSNAQRPKHILIIMVDAKVKPERPIDMSPEKPSVGTMIDAVSSAQMARYTEETTALVQDAVNKLRNHEFAQTRDTQFHLVRVALSSVKRKKATEFFNSLPTSLELSNDEVDALILAGRTLLRDSPDFQQFLAAEDIHGRSIEPMDTTSKKCRGLDALTCFFSNRKQTNTSSSTTD